MTSLQFSAEMVDTKMLYNILKAISFQEFAIVQPLDTGLKLTVEDSKCFETSVYVASSLFSSYHVDDDVDVKFKVSLKVFAECLHIFGDDGTTSTKMSYKSLGHPLCLIMRNNEENITVDCHLSTLNVDDYTEFQLADVCNLNRVVFNGEQFVNKVTDLDMPSDEFELKLTRAPSIFQITSNSILGETVLEVPKQSEMVEIFNVTSDFRSKYAFSNLRQVLKIMAYASKVAITTGDSGLLGVKLIIKSFEGQLYVEYYMNALFEDD